MFLRMINECIKSRVERAEAPIGPCASGLVECTPYYRSMGTAAQKGRSGLTGHNHGPRSMNMLTMRHEHSNKLEQASQENAIPLRGSDRAPVFSKPVRTRPGPGRTDDGIVWPIPRRRNMPECTQHDREMGLGARFSDTHETNCRSMSWLLMQDSKSSPLCCGMHAKRDANTL
jgi:hypothetical protein